MHLCWPRDHSLTVPSLDPDRHWVPSLVIYYSLFVQCGAQHTLPVQHERLNIVCVALQLHKLGTGPGIPDTQHLLCATRHDHCPCRVHGEAVDAVLVPIEAARGDGVVACSESCQGVHIPQKYCLVQPSTCNLTMM